MDEHRKSFVPFLGHRPIAIRDDAAKKKIQKSQKIYCSEFLSSEVLKREIQNSERQKVDFSTPVGRVLSDNNDNLRLPAVCSA